MVGAINMTTFTTEDRENAMNALELALYLENNVEALLSSENKYIDKAVDVLRKQYYEIELLKKGRKPKPVKYTDEWWKEVEEFNKELKAWKNEQ